MENIGKLTTALAAVSRSVGSLQPDKRNKEQNYDYISADKALEIIGKALAEQGLAIIPSVVDDSYETVVYKSYDKEKSRIDARARFIMHITHESGEACAMPWTGYGTDYVTPDKALYKAITSGHKYFLMKLFNVGIGNEDGEHEGHEEPARVAKKTKAPAPAKPAPPTNGRPKASAPNSAKIDARSWLEDKIKDNRVNYGFVLDAAAFTDDYESWQHAQNALIAGYEFPAAFDASERNQIIKGESALNILNWLMSREPAAA